MITHQSYNGSTRRVTPKQKAALILRQRVKELVDSGYFDADMTDAEASAVQEQLEKYEARIKAMLESIIRDVKP